MSGTVRIRAGVYDRDKPGYQCDPETNQGSYLAPAKYTAPGLAVVDHGAKVGRKVYHVPEDGTPGLSVPACSPVTGKSMPGLVRYSRAGFRTLADARAYMLAIADTGILPVGRAATREEVRQLADWLAERTGKEIT